MRPSGNATAARPLLLFGSPTGSSWGHEYGSWVTLRYTAPSVLRAKTTSEPSGNSTRHGYLADAVGTQTEALIIRGLAAKADVQRAFGLEVLTGLAMGLLLGGLAFPAVWLVFGTADLALAVALALMAACSLATVVAMLLPWAMAKAGRDPAFGSGPLATVIQDLLSLLAFFLIAVPIVG